MRISDWSSDVCSSDLLPALPPDARLLPDVQQLLSQPILNLRDRAGPALRALSLPAPEFGQAEPLLLRARRPPRPSVQPKRRLWRAIRLANMPMIQKEWRPHSARRLHQDHRCREAKATKLPCALDRKSTSLNSSH